MKTYFNLSVGQFFYRTGSTIHNIKVSSRLYSTNPTVARNLIEKLKEYQAHLRQKSLLEQYDLSRSYEFEKTKLDTTARILFFKILVQQ
jgi:hypothetical protein